MSAEDRKRFDAMAYLAIEPPIHAETDRQAYRAYCDQQERENQLEQQHGGRTRCPQCDRFEVQHFIAEARRDPTDAGKCRACGNVTI